MNIVLMYSKSAVVWTALRTMAHSGGDHWWGPASRSMVRKDSASISSGFIWTDISATPRRLGLRLFSPRRARQACDERRDGGPWSSPAPDDAFALPGSPQEDPAGRELP